MRSRHNSRRPEALACALALALACPLDASAQFRSPRQIASPRNIGEGSCRLNVRSMEFGGYEDGSPVAVLSTMTVELDCRNIEGIVPVITAGPSANTGYYEQRALAYRDSRLYYQVYINSQRSIIWGDGTGQTQPVVATGSGNTKFFTVYGGIFQGQTGEVGRYSDTLQVTVVP